MKLNKSMLRDGDIVTYRNGNIRIYLKRFETIHLKNGGKAASIKNEYDNELRSIYKCSNDIIKIEHEDGTVEPWEPKVGEEVYFIDSLTESGVWSFVFKDKNEHKLALKRGMIFRTKAEAIEIVKRLDKEGWVR